MILDKNYAQKILDHQKYWESAGLSPTDILTNTLAKIRETIELLAGLGKRMADSEFKRGGFIEGASAQIGAASALSQYRYEQMLQRAEISMQKNEPATQILALLVRTLTQMAAHDPEAASS